MAERRSPRGLLSTAAAAAGAAAGGFAAYARGKALAAHGRLFAAFLARHTGAAEIHLGFGQARLTESIKGLEGFFADCVPLRLSVDAGRPLEQCCRAAVEKLSAIERSGTFPRDLIARQPDLRVQAGQSMPVRVRHLRDFSSLPPAGDAALELLIADDGACLLRINTALIDAAYGESLKNQLTAFLHAAAGRHAPAG